MFRNTCLALLAAAVLAVLPGTVQASGCCQHRGSCEKTDDEKACTDAGGIHYQLGFCDGKTCQPTAAGDPHPINPVGQTVSCAASTLMDLPSPIAAAAGFDCVTKDHEFCRGELGKGNQCVSSTDCTPQQLAECLPGFPTCPKQVEPSPTPLPEY